MRRSLVSAAVSIALLTAPVARADEGSHSIAEALFQAGKSLLADGHVDEACGKLTESQRLGPGGGTLLLLAVCHEKQGRFATAQAEFKSAQSLARRDRRPDREKLAAKHLADLEGKVSTVTVKTREQGTSLVLDGVAISADAAGVPLPVDPGEHRLEVTAPGKKGHTLTFTIGRAAEARVLTVAKLEDAPAEASSTVVDASIGAASTPDEPRSATPRTVGWILAASGGAAMIVGGVFGVRALDQNSDAEALCSDASRCSSREGVRLNDEARTSATVANVAIGVGAALVVGGVVLLLTSSSGSPRGAAVARFGTIAF